MSAKRPAYQLRRALSRATLEAQLAARRLRGDRMRPSLFVIGVQKAGTTSLFRHLERHPQILPPLLKEVHYFDIAAHRGDEWYAAHFPTIDDARAAEDAAGRAVLTFDTTPYYMFHPEVARRIVTFAPEARIIAVLRDPVARAWSHYWHEWARGYEKLSPMAAFDAEPGRLPDPHNHVGDTAAARFAHQHYSYCARSEYDRQIERWRGFVPSERLLCVKSESLFTDTGDTLRQVTDFLGIAPFAQVSEKAANAGRYEQPPAEVADWLSARLAPSISATRALLGPTFSWP